MSHDTHIVEADHSLFERIGGSPAIKATVDEFYKRVLSDPQLKDFFRTTNLKWLKKQQIDFFTTALGGPELYEGRDMRSAHASMAIEEKHFGLVAGHLVDTLKSLNVSADLIKEILAIVGPLSSAIVNSRTDSNNNLNEQGDEEMKAGNETTNGSNGQVVSNGMDDTQERVKRDAWGLLENAPLNIMYADKDLNIVYMNPSSSATLETLAQYLPVPVSEVVGSSIDIFHKNPKHQRKILSNPRNLPVKSKIQIGPETAELLVSPIYDDTGKYQGPMVTWSVITDKLKLENEQTRLEAMVQNAPINIMMADTDLNITYLNPASTNTLNKLAQYLPVPVSKVLGSSVDIFHKNPAHQRKILSDPKNLPMKAVIHLGPETADLLVSPIFDTSGKYIGPMLTWEVVTEKARMEKVNQEHVRLSEAIDKSQAVIEFDMQGTINHANQNFLSALGYGSLKEIQGKHHSMFVEQSYRSSPEYTAFWAKLNRGEFDSGEYKRVTKSGKEIWILASYNPVFDSNGKPYRVVKYASDITAQVIERERLKTEALEKQERERIAAKELSDKVESMLEVVDAASNGDLTKAITVTGTDAIGRMGDGLKKFIVDLRKIISQISESAQNLAASSEELTAVSQQMATNADETAQQSNVVSAASEQVSKNVQTVATGTEEMSASIREIAANSNDAAKVATQAVSVAKTTNDIITKLGVSSAEIGKVIKVITSIAEQTNLLALNATIEAARAGEAGKGFAVVANEVKELAKETAKATEEISQKIGAIQSDTGGAVKAIGEIGDIINKINDISNTIASAVEEQTATTNEMTRNVSEAARGSTEIAENISSVAKAAISTTEGANNSKQASQELSKMAASLQKLVGQFKF